ncbi:MAG: hypothetical protein AAF637_27780, partial [Pseudomonadota bacterium]
HDAMTDAVKRMARLAWRIEWLTPLAADAGFVPQTAALQSILPLIELGDGSSIERLSTRLLDIASERAR